MNAAIAYRTVALGVLALACAGCGQVNRVTLRQPAAPPSQQHITLGVMRAGYADRNGASAVSCELRLPRGGSDLRGFVLYMRLPGERGDAVVNPRHPDAARGFLVQEVGAWAGRTDLVGGTARWKRKWWTGGRPELEVDLVTDDGTSITGTLVMRADERLVAKIERAFEADIASLWPDDAPSTLAESTAPRPGVSPR